MRILGVDLDLTIDSSNFYRYAMLVYGLVLLGLDIYLHVCIMAVEFPETSSWNLSSTSIFHHVNTSATQSSAFAWNNMIDYASYTFIALGLHSALIYLSQTKKWRTLWSNLCLILHDEIKGFDKSIERITIIGLVIIFSVIKVKLRHNIKHFNENELVQVIIWHYVILISIIRNKSDVSVTYVVIRTSWIAVQIYRFCSLLLIGTISWIVVVGFRQLRHQLDEILKMEWPIFDRLTDWRAKHVLLSDTVDGINDCFGLILLVWVIHLFVTYITVPFYILQELRYRNSDNLFLFMLNCWFFVELIVEFLIITVIPSRIGHEVSNIS